MNRSQAIRYITNHVPPDSDEPIFVLLARDDCAPAALEMWRDEVMQRAAGAVRLGEWNTAAQLAGKAAGIAMTIHDFRNYPDKTQPD
jgi:hypothetical protein